MKDATTPTTISPTQKWRQLLMQTWSAANTPNVWAHCASVGFFGFLSIFPIMAVFVLIYNLVFSPAEMQAQIAMLEPFIPPSVYDIIYERLDSLTQNTTTRLSFGLLFSTVLALYSGSRGIKNLVILINLAFHITERRSFIVSIIRAILLTVAALILFIVALSTIAAIPLLAQFFSFGQPFETIVLWSRWPILAIIIFLSFLGLYRFAPNRGAVPIKRLIPGAALATVLWILLSGIFSIYVQNFNNYSATFGALSAAVVIMLWLYYSAFIIALGAMFNYEMTTRRASDAIRVYS
ncbi:YihY/virulence factor BrkB family protein [uncultured Psychrobacter sp.]|uniref:YihY/virulence factor BrkB family protein n=1 Tax=uncultured Psychrobacter sp. TaxID=259303 RepID=UPI002612FE30|nr:YihY/virulence factor BrkB family protein [uncultured Psychrobacter sp.]